MWQWWWWGNAVPLTRMLLVKVRTRGAAMMRREVRRRKGVRANDITGMGAGIDDGVDVEVGEEADYDDASIPLHGKFPG